MFHLLVQLAAAALINAAIPSLAIVLLACALLCIRSWSAATRYIVWWIALMLILVLPFALPVLPARHSQPAPKVRIEVRSAVVAEPITTGPAAPASASVPVLDLIALLCCAATVVQLGRLTYAFRAALRLKQRLSPWPSPMQTRPGRRFRLALADDIFSPLAIGYFRPVIALPAILVSKLNPHELEQVIAHEASHLARYDDWAIALQRLLAALFAFHPLVQFVSWRMSLDREIACDDRVLASAKPAEYASSLAKIAEHVHFNRITTAMTLPLLSRKSNLARRIETILDATRSHVPALSRSRIGAFSLISLLIACAALRVPALIASPLVDTDGSEIGPITLTLPDGSATTFDEDNINSTHHSSFPSGSIVFKSHAKSYIIRDRSTVEESSKLMQPMNDLSRQQEELGKKQQALGQAQELLGNNMQSLSRVMVDAQMQAAIKAQLADVEKQLHSLELRKELQSVEDAQGTLANLQGQLGELQAHLGEQQAKMGEAQSKLGEQMGKLGEKQGRLGELQGELGEKQAKEAERIRRELEQLIEHAQQKGLAQPLQ